VPEPDAAQAAIAVARPAPGFDEPGRPETFAVFRLLNHDFLSRLNTVIREEKGFSYGVDGVLVEEVRNGSVMVVETTVEAENVGEALGDIFDGFAGLETDPVRPDELERTVVSTLSALAGTGETAAGLFDEILGSLGRGSSLEEIHGRRLAITQLSLDAVQAQALTLSSLDRAVIVVAGDAATIRPQLDALDFEITVVDRQLDQ
jgi:predicted Zn-dependent peptidase